MKFLKLAIVFYFVGIIPAYLFGQNFSQVTIKGVVTENSSGLPLEGVRVEAIDETDTTKSRWAFTGSDGHYCLTMTILTGLPRDKDRLPSEFQLFQNYPNPFNPATLIQFQLPRSSHVRLDIYNVLGQKIRSLVNEQMSGDIYAVEWDGTNDAGIGVAAGLYFYRLRTPEYVKTRKMVLLDGLVGAPSGIQRAIVHKKSQFSKPGNVRVTIRATSPYIEPFEQEHVTVSSSPLQFDIGVSCLPQFFRPDDVRISEVSDSGFVFIFGRPGAVINDTEGLLRILVTNHRIDSKVYTDVSPDGSFPLMKIQAREGDWLSMTLCREDQPVSALQELLPPETVAPVVINSKPTNGDKDIILDVIVRIYFSEPVRTEDVTSHSLFLLDSLGKRVPADVGFLSGNTVAYIDPLDSLEVLAAYTIVVTTEVIDLQGYHLEEEYRATFTTDNLILTVPDFQVNENGGISGSDQEWSSLASDGSGNFVVVWADTRNGLREIYAQRFSSDGSAIGPNFRVNDDQNSRKSSADVAMDDQGNFIIIWCSNLNIYAQRYSMYGQPLGKNFKVNQDFGYWSQGSAKISTDTNGNFIIAWQAWSDPVSDKYFIYAQRFTGDGMPLGNNFKVSDDTVSGRRWNPHISMDPQGNFVITWQDERNGDWDIYAQRFTDDGSPRGPNFRVNDDPGTENQYGGTISNDAQGNFIICWKDHRNATMVESDIYAQRYSSDGIPIGPNFNINDDLGTAMHSGASVSMNQSGQFAVTWLDPEIGNIKNDNIVVRIFDNNVNPLGSPFTVNDVSGDYLESASRISLNDDNSLVLCWTDTRNVDRDIYSQRYDSNGNKVGSNFRVNDMAGGPEQVNSDISTDSDGNFLVIWQDGRNGNEDIYGQWYASNGSLLDMNFIINDDQNEFRQEYPAIAMNAGANHVVTWVDYRNVDGPDIFAQHYISYNVPFGNNFRVNDVSGSASVRGPSVDIDSIGNYVITWEDGRNSDIYAQRYFLGGSPIGPNFKVSDDTGTAHQYAPEISTGDNNNFAITWRDRRNGDYDVYAQLYGSNGIPVGINFRVNDDQTGESQGSPDICMDALGNFVITWSDYRNGDADIYAQRYASDGTIIGSNFRVNDDTGITDQMSVCVSSDDQGNFIISWTDERNTSPDIYAQCYDRNGIPLGQNFLVTNITEGVQSGSRVKLWNERIYNTWTDNRVEANGYDIWANILDWTNCAGR
ncbi:MAG: Ig-like domain-containing protein [Calditrichaeota bacterium]|nr:Ig-like domain-containing protein [Calditrichota bacterium]